MYLQSLRSVPLTAASRSRLGLGLRAVARPATRRSLSTETTSSSTTTAAAAAAPESSFRAPPLPPPKKPVGAVRGGIMGMLFGFVVAGATGYYFLLDDYSVYSNALLTNVEELGSSVESIRSRLAKIDSIESAVKSLKSTAIHHDDLDKAKRDLYKSLDAMTVEHLELKTRVWALEQELKKRA
ncbi:hypothetical protein BCR44DRAFT_60742 [Catenaria anguillulae PL171]|uniref:Uncharacterized protein n=1 Tax=Catenaria anguillulae PL171 TaxID=765915 RepID=A0A1Y2HD40_9FUNG|nr:hypothetical protein BCR44DRAFT_60742 [Catenaria anguillulae PL171]